jgi:cytochrome c5
MIAAAQRLAVAILAVTVGVPASAAAPGIDLHAFWDDRCFECHGHAGAFARQILSVRDGRLSGRHHEDDLRAFLRQHYMSEPLAERVHDMLLAQVRTEPVYQQKCARCHETAAALVRNSIDFDNGVLVAKSARTPLLRFLVRHGGGLTPAELTTVMSSLERIRAEVLGTPDAQPETRK